MGNKMGSEQRSDSFYTPARLPLVMGTSFYLWRLVFLPAGTAEGYVRGHVTAAWIPDLIIRRGTRVITSATIETDDRNLNPSFVHGYLTSSIEDLGEGIGDHVCAAPIDEGDTTM